jgi:uncharacterized protein (TIGR02284 family)
MEPSVVNHAVSLSMLSDLIETSKDGERGFSMATQDNREPGVADVLKDGEESSRVAATELREQMQLLGGAAEESGPVGAPMYRGWTNFKAVTISRDTKLILEECERGADYARSRYEAAIKLDLPESARAIVERQYQRVMAIQGRLRLLRNRYPASDRSVRREYSS